MRPSLLDNLEKQSMILYFQHCILSFFIKQLNLKSICFVRRNSAKMTLCHRLLVLVHWNYM